MPADTIKGVLFFKISKKDPTENKGRENVLFHPYEASGIGCLYRCKEEGQGSADKRSFFFQNLRKGVSFFKNWILQWKAPYGMNDRGVE